MTSTVGIINKAGVTGTFYGIGVGPGDPELMTLKAVKTIGVCDVIAAPGSGAERQTALNIAGAYIKSKQIILLEMPMTRDHETIRGSHRQAADIICGKLSEGKNVGFLTLGDPMLYSTYSYLHKLVEARGFSAKAVPGVTSFCAAAAALGEPLCEGGEALHIIPASYGDLDGAIDLPGTKILMKSGKKLSDAIELLKEKNMLAKSLLAERVGMEGEKLMHDLSEETCAGYFSVVIIKEDEKK
jgi:precorrin-2/cobalt-factor-2 C20-methyltransferase